jgi:hypothetical protein
MSKEISFFVLLLFIVNPSVGSVVEDEDELSFRHFDGDRNVTFKKRIDVFGTLDKRTDGRRWSFAIVQRRYLQVNK